jgi:hypothetical protein
VPGHGSSHRSLSVSFPDIDILHPALLSSPPRTVCLYNYWIAYIWEGAVLQVMVAWSLTWRVTR